MGVKILRRRRNPDSGDELPYDKWIPAEAVRFHTNGTVDIERPGSQTNRGRRRRNISDGFFSGGVFHPIRWAADYDPERAGEDEEGYNIRPSTAHYKKWGLKAPKTAPRPGSKRKRTARKKTAKKRTAKKKTARKTRTRAKARRR